MRAIRRWFIAGLAVVLPTVVTAWLLWKIFSTVDRLLDPLEIRLLGFDVPGLGFVVVLLLLIVAGAVGGNFVGKRLLRLYQTVVERVPLAGKIYRSVQQIMDVFVRDNTQTFKSVVSFEYPRRGLWAIGFVSGETPLTWTPDDAGRCVNVFLPTSPNPTSGYLLLVPKSDLRRLPISVEEAMKSIISGGAYVPEEKTPPPTGDRP